MATPIADLLPPSGDPFVDAITNGSRWEVGADQTIFWSFSNGFLGESWPDPAAVFNTIDTALQIYSTYIPINFEYVGYFDNAETAYNAGSDINVSLSRDTNAFPSNNIWAFGNFPSQQLSGIGSGDIYLNLNSEAAALQSYAPGSAGWFLLVHELGHTLGLKHPFDDGGTGRQTFVDIGAVNFDNDFASVMSYTDDYDFDRIAYDPATPMLIDVIGLQYLYGVNRNHHVGDDVYDLSADNLYLTIWDAGGNDTLSASSSDRGWAIQLPTTPISSAVPELFGYALPLNEIGLEAPLTLAWLEGEMENAVGSAFQDQLYGNGLRNAFLPGTGADYINGGDGLDIAGYNAPTTSFAFSRSGDTVTLSGAGSNDTLVSIERIAFSNGTLALDTGTGENAGVVFRTYQAAYDRVPDQAGLGFWINAADQGTSFEQIAAGFLQSSEFAAAYGTNPSAETFVAKLYENVLGRPGEQGGIDFWKSALADGMHEATVLYRFAESSENVAILAPQIQDGIFFV